MKSTAVLSSLLVLALPLGALAQETEQPTEQPLNDGRLPAPQSDNDPHPEVASPTPAVGGVVSQAGVGGPIGYGRAGVLELGGSAALTAATDFRQVLITPSIGWFIADNVQLSGLFDIGWVDTGPQSSSIVSLLAEPSYHLPFSRTFFGFLGLGLGLGLSHVEDFGFGFALAPRLGVNALIGRSGVLTPSLSWQYNTHDATAGEQEGASLVAVSSAVRFNIGYTVMW